MITPRCEKMKKKKDKTGKQERKRSYEGDIPRIRIRASHLVDLDELGGVSMCNEVGRRGVRDGWRRRDLKMR